MIPEHRAADVMIAVALAALIIVATPGLALAGIVGLAMLMIVGLARIAGVIGARRGHKRRR